MMFSRRTQVDGFYIWQQPKVGAADAGDRRPNLRAAEELSTPQVSLHWLLGQQGACPEHDGETIYILFRDTQSFTKCISKILGDFIIERKTEI